ncbi:unnamed protein product [Prorocentrum cordatum]|uniref:Uncharacterized protein n=1 Tax=Prorocentrum cordatum TaxID=2364126 RepID=A0ABN9R7A4_9DINO|nr:unnamed protein product [Polarella glacialis]
MSLQGSLAPVAAKLPNGLTSKNTFLDHPSPWIDYVTVGDRPKSDPTSDATSSSTAEVASSGGNSWVGEFGGGRLPKEEDAKQQAGRSSEKCGTDSSDGSRMSLKPQSIGRSQRRRMQRKAMEVYWGTQGAHSAAEHTAARTPCEVAPAPRSLCDCPWSG